MSFETPQQRTERIQYLKRQIQEGKYFPDAEKILAGMLGSPEKVEEALKGVKTCPHPNGKDLLIHFNGLFFVQRSHDGRVTKVNTNQRKALRAYIQERFGQADD